MKTIKMTIAALVLCGMTACCCNEPKTLNGVIADGSMNNIVVTTATGQNYTFSTEGADMSQANGLLIGAPVEVEYKGKLKEGTPALKVSANATYAEAVGSWTMPDPLAPDSLKMGVELMIEGKAQSINMATLPYSSWELQGEPGRIILHGQSIGNGVTSDFTQTGLIAKDAEGRYSLTIEDTELVYTKSF